MRTRIKDIAERVGVSTALVSMYLNDHPLARMAEDTKRKIDEAVREMNYQELRGSYFFRRRTADAVGIPLGRFGASAGNPYNRGNFRLLQSNRFVENFRPMFPDSFRSQTAG